MVLRNDLGLDVFYYVLHRDGEPFTNMMNIESRGVGLFGHVFTKPEDRQQGAAGALMPLLMEDFRSRGGQALYLGTGYDSHPFHLYAKNGFFGVEPRSGLMAYYLDSEAAFYASYFQGEAEIETLKWTHWPAADPLFTGNFKGTVRSTVMRIMGRSSTEGPMIPLERAEIKRQEDGEGPRSVVLPIQETGAVAGFATFGRHPLWSGTWTVDVYCHPEYWDQGTELFATMEFPPAERLLAYCDSGFDEKEKVLKEAGFEPITTFENRVAADEARTQFVTVREWEKIL
jgi:GNAT superfamily N-acetyltransferase